MQDFLAIFTGTEAALKRARWAELDDATRRAREAAGRQAWHQWMDRHAESVVSTGGPLGKTKRVGPDGVVDVRNAMVAWVVVRAASHGEAAAMFAGHPHFSIFPGDSVEVMECLPVPTG